jgi:Anti-sigma-K factor rskA, C-terminal/Sigma-70, region 4
MSRRMSPLEPLAPDQRAVVALVLQQGRSYDEIAALLGIQVDAVRARARAGLAALAPADGLPGEITAPLADYLLGQQPDADAEATRGLLEESAPARAWASDVAARLAEVAKSPLPEIPGAAAPGSASATAAPDDPSAAAAPADPSVVAAPDDSSAAAAAARAGASSGSPAAAASAAAATADSPLPGPRPRPVREAAGDGGPPPASKLGGVLLIAAVIAAVAVVLFLVLRGDDDDNQPAASGTASATATATPTPTAQPQVADQIALRATGGGKAKGTMTVYLQGEQLLFALQGENLPPSGQNDAYAVWVTGPGDKARRLGFTNPVGQDGKLGIQGPSQKDLADFPKMYATYANVVVSQESSEDAKRPTRIVLTGKLPQGR